MRNKHTNRALKQGNYHYNDYKGNNGYIKVKRQINIFTMLKWLCIIVTMLIITFYLLNRVITMQIHIEILKAHNAYDKTIESIRDIELSILKDNRYRLTDLEYKNQYDKIYNKFESKMYRTWTNKDLIIIK